MTHSWVPGIRVCTSGWGEGTLFIQPHLPCESSIGIVHLCQSHTYSCIHFGLTLILHTSPLCSQKALISRMAAKPKCSDSCWLTCPCWQLHRIQTALYPSESSNKKPVWAHPWNSPNLPANGVFVIRGRECWLVRALASLWNGLLPRGLSAQRGALTEVQWVGEATCSVICMQRTWTDHRSPFHSCWPLVYENHHGHLHGKSHLHCEGRALVGALVPRVLDAFFTQRAIKGDSGDARVCRKRWITHSLKWITNTGRWREQE